MKVVAFLKLRGESSKVVYGYPTAAITQLRANQLQGLMFVYFGL
jgi:hypothetical protein